MNKNTVQRIFQLNGWQVKKRAVGSRPRIEAKVSAAERPDERWATDLCRVWGGRDGWLVLALVIDCYTRQLLGWQLSRSGKATTAAAALQYRDVDKRVIQLPRSAFVDAEKLDPGLRRDDQLTSKDRSQPSSGMASRSLPAH